jgi:pimeloyl-ACP methyl ester carboxylesterase
LVQELFGNVDQLRRSWYLMALQIPTLPEWFIRSNLRSIVKDLFQGQAIRKGAFTTQDTELYQAALEKPGALTAVLNHYRHLFSLQTWWNQWIHAPAPISAPTLILWGEDDFLFSEKLTEGVERWVKAPVKLKFLAHCGHWIQQEAPQTVNRELLDFLQARSLAWENA